MHYQATLFRGWDTVRLEYSLDGNSITLRRRFTWKKPDELQGDLVSLSGEVRRVWGRQLAHLASTLLILAALAVLAIDAMIHGVGAGGTVGGIYWPLWAPMLVVVAMLGYVRARVRHAAEWTHFVGTQKGVGLYILREPRNPTSHDQFVNKLKYRIEKAIAQSRV